MWRGQRLRHSYAGSKEMGDQKKKHASCCIWEQAYVVWRTWGLFLAMHCENKKRFIYVAAFWSYVFHLQVCNLRIDMWFILGFHLSSFLPSLPFPSLLYLLPSVFHAFLDPYCAFWSQIVFNPDCICFFDASTAKMLHPSFEIQNNKRGFPKPLKVSINTQQGQRSVDLLSMASDWKSCNFWGTCLSISTKNGESPSHHGFQY